MKECWADPDSTSSTPTENQENLPYRHKKRKKERYRTYQTKTYQVKEINSAREVQAQLCTLNNMPEAERATQTEIHQ